MTHKEIGIVCSKLGMSTPPAEGTKAERLLASFDGTPDTQLPSVAKLFLKQYPPSASDRNRIQDLIWQDSASPEINKKVRRNVARALESEPLYLRVEGFDRLLNKLWVLDLSSD